VIDDSNPLPPGLHNKSIIVATPGREIQLTAPNKERHELWVSVSRLRTQSRGKADTLGITIPPTTTERRLP
jgi:hypothetical protein